jgi:replicative DNA helicase
VLFRSDYDWTVLEKKVGDVQDLPLIFEGQGCTQVNQIVSLLESLKELYHVRFLIVDYLQLMAKNTEDLDTLVGALKDLAISRGLHVLAISSLKREGAGVIVPTTRSLRGSQGLAYGADTVMLLHQPHAMDRELDYRWEGVAILNTDKQRNGPKGSGHLRWNPARLVFDHMTDDEVRKLPPLHHD